MDFGKHPVICNYHDFHIMSGDNRDNIFKKKQVDIKWQEHECNGIRVAMREKCLFMKQK